MVSVSGLPDPGDLQRIAFLPQLPTTIPPVSLVEKGPVGIVDFIIEPPTDPVFILAPAQYWAGSELIGGGVCEVMLEEDGSFDMGACTHRLSIAEAFLQQGQAQEFLDDFVGSIREFIAAYVTGVADFIGERLAELTDEWLERWVISPVSLPLVFSTRLTMPSSDPMTPSFCFTKTLKRPRRRFNPLPFRTASILLTSK
ncbi:unnamed protein product [Chrysoparadoxa australica]